MRQMWCVVVTACVVSIPTRYHIICNWSVVIVLNYETLLYVTPVGVTPNPVSSMDPDYSLECMGGWWWPLYLSRYTWSKFKTSSHGIFFSAIILLIVAVYCFASSSSFGVTDGSNWQSPTVYVTCIRETSLIYIYSTPLPCGALEISVEWCECTQWSVGEATRLPCHSQQNMNHRG